MRRFSIPVKIVIGSALAYLAVLLAGGWFLTHDPRAAEPLYGGISWPTLWLAAKILVPLLVFCLATYCYFDRPLRRLCRTMTEAGEGDFLVRAPHLGRGEVGNLSRHFNQMLVKLTDLAARKIQADHELIAAQETLKFKNQLEEKNRQIARANRSLENLVRDLSLLYEIGQRINHAMDVSQLYELVPEVLNKHLKLENFSLMVWESKKRILEVKSVYGFDDLQLVKEMTFHGGEGIAGEVMESGQAIYVPDLSTDRRFARREAGAVIGSVLSVPLHYKGETIGVVNFGRDEIDAFSPHDIKMLTLAANQIALGLANARLYTQTRELSVTDELTGVFNRRHFNQGLQLEWKRAVRFKRDLSLLMIDVDYFKRYNDTHGHLKGDEVLRAIGRMLAKNLREVDTVARFGGEEFILLLPDTDQRGAIAVAEKLRHLIQENIPAITVSIGVAHYPDGVQEMDDLIDRADIALYEAKDRGRNRVVLCRAGSQEPLEAAPVGEEKREESSKTRLVH